MKSRVPAVLLLVLGMLGITLADPAFAADITPPVLHAVSLAAPGPFTAGDTVTVNWDATDDVAVSQVQVGLYDAVGHEKVIAGNGDASNGHAVIDYRWANGPVTVRWVWVFDTNNNFTVYYPNGTTGDNFGAQGTHTLDLHALEFTTHDTGEDLDPPVLTALSRTSPSTSTVGDQVSLSWTGTEAHSGWLQAVFVDAACKEHTVNGGATGPGGSKVVDQSWAAGPVQLLEVQVGDDSGNLRIYHADGSTQVGHDVNAMTPGPAHSFDFASMGFTTYATGSDTTPPALSSVSLHSPGPFYKGSTVQVDWSATDDVAVASVVVALTDAAGKPHDITAAAADAPATATIDGTWSTGRVSVFSVKVIDTSGNEAFYNRLGDHTWTPSCAQAATHHDFDFSQLDFDVDADNSAPTATASSPGGFALAANPLAAWSGSDVGSGISSYDVKLANGTPTTAFSAWTVPSGWAGLTATSKPAPSMARGVTECFAVRAHDRSGNVGPWSASRCVARPVDDTALARSTGWTRITATTLYAGSALRTSTLGASVTYGKATLRRVGVVATTCPTCGTVGVYVAGHLVGKLSLATSTWKRQQVLSLPAFSSRTGAVTVRVLTSGRNVYLDGLALSLF